MGSRLSLPAPRLVIRERGPAIDYEGGGRGREFSRLYSAHAPQLFRYFWVHTRSRALAEDLVSETFLRAFGKLAGYSADRGSFSSWLFGIGRRILARHRREWGQGPLTELGDRAFAPGEIPDPTPALVERIDLWQAVSDLSDVERDVIALKFGAGLTHQEIAEITGLRAAYVGVVIYRALQRLRSRLPGEVEGDER